MTIYDFDNASFLIVSSTTDKNIIDVLSSFGITDTVFMMLSLVCMTTYDKVTTYWLNLVLQVLRHDLNLTLTAQWYIM